MNKFLFLFPMLFLGLAWSSVSKGEPPVFQTQQFYPVQVLSPAVFEGIKVEKICDLDLSTVHLIATTTSLNASKDSTDLTVDCGNNDMFGLRVHRDVFKEGGILAKEGDKVTLNQVTGQKISSTLPGPDDDAISSLTFDTVNLEISKKGATEMVLLMTYSPKITSSNEDLIVKIDGVAASKAMADAAAEAGDSPTNPSQPVQAAAPTGPVATKAEGGCSLSDGGDTGMGFSYLAHLMAMLGVAGLLGIHLFTKRDRSV